MDDDRNSRVDAVRHALLELHKAMIDAQRVRYEREHGRIATASEYLGIVLEHPQFEWIRSLSALMAQLDEWREEAGAASGLEFEDILDAVRLLLQRDGPNPHFALPYWEMLEATPEVFIAHVKLGRLIHSADGRADPRPAG